MEITWHPCGALPVSNQSAEHVNTNKALVVCWWETFQNKSSIHAHIGHFAQQLHLKPLKADYWWPLHKSVHLKNAFLTRIRAPVCKSAEEQWIFSPLDPIHVFIGLKEVSIFHLIDWSFGSFNDSWTLSLFRASTDPRCVNIEQIPRCNAAYERAIFRELSLLFLYKHIN